MAEQIRIKSWRHFCWEFWQPNINWDEMGKYSGEEICDSTRGDDTSNHQHEYINSEIFDSKFKSPKHRSWIFIMFTCIFRQSPHCQFSFLRGKPFCRPWKIGKNKKGTNRNKYSQRALNNLIWAYESRDGTYKHPSPSTQTSCAVQTTDDSSGD